MFTINQPVFITTLKKKGIVKGIDGFKFKVIYHPDKDSKHASDWFHKKDLKPWQPKRKGLDYAVDQVRQFHKAFNHPTNDKPTPMTVDVAVKRTNWKAEEMVEFLYATVKGDKIDFLSVVAKLKSAIEETAMKLIDKAEPVEDVLVGQTDALIDEEYFLKGDFTIMGIEPQSLFDIVQQANMSKLFPDGKPRFREGDGKIIKPEGWVAPEPLLKAEIERQKKLKK